MTRLLRMPGELVWKGATPLITFGTIDGDLMSRPFLTQKLGDMRIDGLASLDQIEIADDGGDLGVAGTIFHTSRSGSTLLCRQFDALDSVAALSEPFAFQHLLEGPPAPLAVTVRRFRTLMALFRDALLPIAERFVIKWPLLACHHGKTIAEALPGVPRLFLYRNPVEVLASIDAEPLGGLGHVLPHHVGGAAIPDRTVPVCAAVIATACKSIARCAGVRTLDYALLPEAAAERVAPFFGLAGNAAMMEAARRDAKHRKRIFVTDAETKRANASPLVRAQAASIVQPALAEALARLEPLMAPALVSASAEA